MISLGRARPGRSQPSLPTDDDISFSPKNNNIHCELFTVVKTCNGGEKKGRLLHSDVSRSRVGATERVIGGGLAALWLINSMDPCSFILRISDVPGKIETMTADIPTACLLYDRCRSVDYNSMCLGWISPLSVILLFYILLPMWRLRPHLESIPFNSPVSGMFSAVDDMQ